MFNCQLELTNWFGVSNVAPEGVIVVVGLISVYFLPGPNWILLSMLGVGIAWASILSMPYTILSGALPAHKMGLYMGIFNFFIVLP